MYEILYNKAISEQLDIVVCDALWVYEDGKKESRGTLPKFLKEFNYSTYMMSNPAPWNKIIKRELWIKEKIKFPEDILYEDFAIIPAMPKYTKKIGHINKELYFYRQRENSTMQKVEYTEKLLDIIKACNYLYLSLKDTEFIKELEYLYIFQLIYFSSFIFLKFDKFEDIQKCVKEVYSKFPNWKKNEYYKKKPFLFKMFCNLICNEQYKLVKLLIKVRK